ncbi:MAG: Dabb family protein [Clostridia bacterium]
MKHIICIKLKDNSPKHCEKVKELLLSMEGKVPMVKSVWVGLDFLHSPRSFDVIMIAELESREVLEEYQNEPYHAGVVKKYLNEASEKIIALDCCD